MKSKNPIAFTKPFGIFTPIKANETETATDVLYKKVFLEISQNSQENTFARVSFLVKLQVNFAKFLRTPFFAEHLRWQLLQVEKHNHFQNHL